MATAEFKVFHGVGAIIAQVSSSTTFSVFTIIDKEHVDFSASDRRLEVDLKATPLNVGKPGAVTAFSDVKFDDRGMDELGNPLPDSLSGVSVNLGITTIGVGESDNLRRGAFVGALYIEHDLFHEIKRTKIDVAGKPAWPGIAGYKLYEMTSIAYSKNATNGRRAQMRYHGFQAEVVNAGGTDAKGRPTIGVEFRHERAVKKQGPFFFTLNEPDQYDLDPPADALGGASSIAANPTIGSHGALFVALPLAGQLVLSGPKLPIGQG
jgi:hypothetical protein